MSIQEGLELLGLSANEARIYLALIDLGKAPAYQVSKRAGIPRTSAYSILEALEGKSLISREQKQATTFFIVTPPSSLVRMIEHEREEVTTRMKHALRISQELEPLLQRRSTSRPRLQFFEGKRAIDGMLYTHAEAWHQSMLETDCTWWGFEAPQLYEHFKPWFEYIWKRFEKERQEKIAVKVFSPTTVSRHLMAKFPRTELRPFPHPQFLKSSVWLLGNYLVILVTHEKPHYAYQIHDKVLAESFRMFLQATWNLSK